MLLRIPGVLTADELVAARALWAAAPWVDGRVTAGRQSAEVKGNRQLADDLPATAELRHLVLRGLGRSATFRSAALPLRIQPPLFNRYESGMAFGIHVDNAVRGLDQPLRTDVSGTLFLADPSEYDGGELVIESTYGVQRVKLAAGELILYPSTSLHQVLPVTRGARVASFFWVQSMVRDDGRRTLLYDLDCSIIRLGQQLGGNHPEVVSLTGVYHNLLRQWVEV